MQVVPKNYFIARKTHDWDDADGGEKLNDECNASVFRI